MPSLFSILTDCKVISKNIKNYCGCKKLDVTYKKTDLVRLIENNTLNNFAERERANYDMAKRLNMLR